MEIFFVRELAARASAADKPFVVVNTLNPGLCESTLLRDMDGLLAVAVAIYATLLQRKTHVGARTLVHATAAGKESHGQFLSACHVEVSPLDSGKWEEEKLRKRIWNELMMRLEKIEPGVSQII